MVNVKEVPADVFIEELAKYLKDNVSVVKPPTWALFVKTSPSKERVPDYTDWWYVRTASILRKLYVSRKPVGVGTLRTVYGGLKRRGSAPPHFRRSGSSIIRHILHQLETAGLVMKVGKEGRTLTPKGMSLMDYIASEAFKKLVELRPELSKYG
ncbi:MAG: 30S ribosomal protein S19e [Desulfurococcaceae archaeon TW002]